MSADFIVGSIAGMLIGTICGAITSAVVIIAAKCNSDEKR
jgi:hypothetical protein